MQVTAEPIGPTIDAFRGRLDGWRGTPKRGFFEGRGTLGYRCLAEGEPPLRLKLKEVANRCHTGGLRSSPHR